MQRASCIERDQHHPLEGAAQGAFARGDGLGLVGRVEQLGGQGAELAGPALALGGEPRLGPDPSGEPAHQQRDAEHRRQRDQVLVVLDRERVAGRHEEEVERRDRGDRARHRRHPVAG